MSQVPRIHKPQSRLKNALNRATLQTKHDAVSKAQTNLENYSEECDQDVGRSLKLLNTHLKTVLEDPTPENCCDLYSSSSRIIGAASIIGASELVDLARRLCDLLDQQAKVGVVSPAPVAVLVNSMTFAFKARHEGVDMSQLHEGLNKLMQHYKT